MYKPTMHEPPDLELTQALRMHALLNSSVTWTYSLTYMDMSIIY